MPLLRTLPCLLLLAALGRLPAAHGADEVKELVRKLEASATETFEQDKRESAIRDLGRLGGAEAAAALVPVFKDPFVHLHDRAVSAWIDMLAGPHAADTQTWLAGHALADKSPDVRRGAATALAVTGGPELEAPFRQALGHEKDPAALAALAEAAARLRGPPDLGAAVLDRLDAKDGAAAFQLALAAAQLAGPKAVAPLERLLRHRAPLARAGAVLALQRLDALSEQGLQLALADKDPEPPMAVAESLALRTKLLPWPGRGEGVLEQLLAHRSWRVRAAAVQGALRLWDNRIVEPLIARLPAEQGRLQDDVRRALETYTGQFTQGTDPDLWRAWWGQKGGAFDPGTAPRPDAAGNVAFREASEALAADPGATAAFFDLPLQSKHFAFVFDLSGSMGNVAQKGATSGATKLDLLKAEMRKTLESLPEDTLFDLFVYRYWSGFPPKTKLTRALGKMQPCSKANVRKALAWLDGQEAKGWGAFYEPLEALLAEDVDSVVLLSDGRPSRGVYDRDFRILTELPKANRFRRMAVNTVLVGTKGADRKFMQALAAATGGRFRSVGDK